MNDATNQPLKPLQSPQRLLEKLRKQSIHLEGDLMVNRRFGVIAFLLVVGVSILGIRGFGFLGDPERAGAANADSKTTVANIAKQEMTLAKEALKTVTQLEQQGQATPGSHEVSIWSRRLVEATRKSGAKMPEVIEAIKQHLARMNESLEVVKRLRKAQVATTMDVINAQYEALEAMVWLEEVQEK